MRIDYATPQTSSGWSGSQRRRVLAVAAAAYILAYAVLRISGALYPFYNQGNWDEIDCSEGTPEYVAIAFFPLAEIELAYHNRFTPPPDGG